MQNIFTPLTICAELDEVLSVNTSLQASACTNLSEIGDSYTTINPKNDHQHDLAGAGSFSFSKSQPALSKPVLGNVEGKGHSEHSEGSASAITTQNSTLSIHNSTL